MREAVQMAAKMEAAWKSIHKFYAFDPKKYKMEDLFNDLKTFKEQYEVSGNGIFLKTTLSP